jgi:hypothetical protein
MANTMRTAFSGSFTNSRRIAASMSLSFPAFLLPSGAPMLFPLIAGYDRIGLSDGAAF